jgi:hypothetical protein
MLADDQELPLFPVHTLTHCGPAALVAAAAGVTWRNF